MTMIMSTMMMRFPSQTRTWLLGTTMNLTPTLKFRLLPRG